MQEETAVKKIISMMLCLMLCAALVPAVAEGNVVRVAYGYDPNTLDYGMSNLDTANFILTHIAETLLTQDASGAYVPGVAESFKKSEDGKVWTFTIRQGLTYQDGTTPITADDLYYAAQRLLNPADPKDNATFNFVNAEAYYNGEVSFEEVGVKKLDDYTIEYTFINPTSPTKAPSPARASTLLWSRPMWKRAAKSTAPPPTCPWPTAPTWCRNGWTTPA